MHNLLNMAVWAAQQNGGGTGDQPDNPLPQMLLMFALIAVVFWFILLRPQQKERKERERKLASIKEGDKIVTIGGIHGKITEIDENRDILTVEVAPKVPMKFNRGAIHVVESKESAAGPNPPQKQQ